METQALREAVTDAIRYWELRRVFYNVVLAGIVVFYFWAYYPSSKEILNVDAALGIFLLAVGANVAYCAAYPVDIFAQLSDYRPLWHKFRWIVFVLGVLVAGILTRFMAQGMFLSVSH